MSKSRQVPQTDGAGDWRPLTPFGDLGLTPLLWEWSRSASTYKSSCKQIVYCILKSCPITYANVYTHTHAHTSKKSE